MSEIQEKQDSKKKTAFVLAGGGAAGSYQAGALQALETAGIVPDFVWGTSAGALNATGYSFAGMKETVAMWRSIRRRSDIFGANLFRYLGLPFGVDGIYNSNPLRKKILALIKNKNPRVPVFVNVTDLNTGRLVQATTGSMSDERFAEWARASASIPVLVEPVAERYVDGGVLENVPLKSVIAQGATRIFMILCSPKDKEKRIKNKEDVSGVIGIAKRSIELIMNEGYWEDVEICKQMNSHPDKKFIELHVIAPEEEMLGAVEFDKEKISKALSQGYEDAKRLISKLP